MFIGFLFFGALLGGISAAGALLAGTSFWAALAVYSLVGSGATIAGVVLSCALSHWRDSAASQTGPMVTSTRS